MLAYGFKMQIFFVLKERYLIKSGSHQLSSFISCLLEFSVKPFNTLRMLGNLVWFFVLNRLF